MRVLVACEYSGIVRDAFAAKGHYAMSCDLLPTESEGLHYQGDVLNIINDGWDLMIAHPPCTHLAISGARHFHKKQEEQLQALDFVQKLLDAPIEMICLENPVSIISTRIKKPTQIIQPYEYGHSVSKKTCLWLKNLPKLKPTNIVDKGEFITFPSGKRMHSWYASKWGDGKARSAFWKGIAEAMADQWG
jgi:site-specific DNA-cytosine methylase